MKPDPIAPAPCPWPVGSRVKLTRPDGPNHPRRGRVGTVVRCRWFEAVCKWDRGEPKETEPATWMVWVRFATQEDKFDGIPYGIFPREFEVLTTGDPDGRTDTGPAGEPDPLPGPDRHRDDPGLLRGRDRIGGDRPGGPTGSGEPLALPPGPAPEAPAPAWGWSALFAIGGGTPSIACVAVQSDPGLVETTVDPGRAARWSSLAEVRAWLESVGMPEGAKCPIGTGVGEFTPVLILDGPASLVHPLGIPFRYRHRPATSATVDKSPDDNTPIVADPVPPAPHKSRAKRSKPRDEGPSLFALANEEEGSQ